MNRFTLTIAALLCATIIGAGHLSAAPVTWTLTGVTFNDGGTASGTFTWNADTDTIGDYSISVTGGNTGTFPAFTWDPADSNFKLDDGTFVFIGPPLPNESDTRDFRVNPDFSLTDGGGSTGLNQNGFGSVECYNCDPIRFITAGTLVGTLVTPTPEPGTAALVSITCVIGLGLFRRKTIWAVKRIAAAGVKGGSQ